MISAPDMALRVKSTHNGPMETTTVHMDWTQVYPGIYNRHRTVELPAKILLNLHRHLRRVQSLDDGYT